VLGWKALPIVVFAGSLLGTFISLPLLIAKRRRAPLPAPGAAPDAEPSLTRVEVPFGPFLAMAAVLDLFAGPAILRLLLGG
jgi:prepilin signal peptidase PulO-like enzyme (type II secretory pathway)